MTKAVHGNGRTETYTYDTVGNVLTFNNGTNSHTYTYGDEYGWKDLLTAVDGQALEYDSSGNPVSYYNGYRYSMSWTEGRKLESVTYNNKTSSYEYNHEGLRTKQTLRDGSYIIYEIVDGVYVGETRYNASNNVILYMRYLLDESSGVVGISLWYPDDTVWTDYYFVKNLQGDVLSVHKASDGTLAVSYTYDSWGNILSKSGSLASINPFRYRSYYFDEQMWFYYLESRYYDPAIGRFINADAFTSTGQGILGNNMFAYCRNNPVCRKDVAGTEDVIAFDDGEILSNDDLEERAKGGGSKSTQIYRYGGTNKGNLVPREKDVTAKNKSGLSFSTEYRPGSVTTTIEEVNNTGVLYAVQDGTTHVSIYPIGATMREWFFAGTDSIWTQTLRGIVEKAK